MSLMEITYSTQANYTAEQIDKTLSFAASTFYIILLFLNAHHSMNTYCLDLSCQFNDTCMLNKYTKGDFLYSNRDLSKYSSQHDSD